MPVSIVVLSAVRVFGDGVAELLANGSDVTVLAVASDGEAASACAMVMRPDVILVDFALPNIMDVVTGLAQSRYVVVMAVPEDHRALVACAEAGAVGFVTVNATAADVRSAVIGATRGEVACPPALVATLIKRLAARAEGRVSPPHLLPLTLREQQIARLIDEGLANKEIALRLGIEVTTVKNHVHNILRKLHVHRRAEAVAHLRHRPVRTASVIGLA